MPAGKSGVVAMPPRPPRFAGPLPLPAGARGYLRAAPIAIHGESPYDCAQQGGGTVVCICKNQLAAASAALARANLNLSVTPPTAAMNLAAHLSLAPPQLDPGLLDALKNLQIPPLAMGAGTGTLSGLVNAAMMIKATLGIN